MSQANATYGMPVLTVTATKQKHDLQQVPASLTAFSSTQIQDASIDDLRDLHFHVPNLRFYNAGGRSSFSFTNIRGLSNSVLVGTPAVTLYIDDVPYASPRNFDHELFDIERIEVLRGPQGTLYGKNTEGGVINIVTKRPAEYWEGTLNQEFASAGSTATKAGLYGPLIDETLSIALSGQYDKRDGYYLNTFNDKKLDPQEGLSGRAKLMWTPTQDLAVDLAVSGQRFNDGGGFFFTPITRDLYNTVYPGADVDAFETWQDETGSVDMHADVQSLRIVHDTGQGEVIAVTARQAMVNRGRVDADFSGLDNKVVWGDVDTTTWSQEIRFVSPEDAGPVSFVGGVYGDHRRWEYEASTLFGSDSPLVMGGLFPAGSEFRHNNVLLEDLTLAGFGQLSYRLCGNRLGLSAGLRLEYFQEDGEKEQRYIIGGMEAPAGFPPAITGLPQPARFGEVYTTVQWLPKFVVDYRFTPDLMGYVSAAKGYKPGGLNWTSFDPQESVYEAEESWTFEAGIKSSWWDDRFVLNLTGFYSIVDEYQDSIVNEPPFFVLNNVASATIKGFEAEARVRPTRSMELTGTFGYADARYDDYDGFILNPDFSSSPQSFDGNRIVVTPEYDFSFAAQYRFACGFFMRGEIHGYGEYYIDQANTRKQEAYQIYNAKIGYETEHLDVYLFGRNLTEEEYFVHGVSGEFTPLGQNWYGVLSPPRSFGVGITARF